MDPRTANTVQKLLNLAKDNANPHEAETALRLAQRILQKHGAILPTAICHLCGQKTRPVLCPRCGGDSAWSVLVVAPQGHM